MKSTAFLTPMALIMAMMAHDASAHGRLLVPPHRGYIGSLPQFKDFVPKNYGDHSLNAGGIGQTKGGKHGICGDKFSGKRLHETGGEYGKFPQHREKVIGACYAPGSTMDLQVQITANHKGYFEFGLCKLNSLNDKETEECFKTLVQPNGEKHWKLPTGAKTFNMQYMLPDGMSCDGDSHCVLRWHYVGWNNPDADINGQEHYWNCADIYVSNTCGSNPSSSASKPAIPNAPKQTTSSSNADTQPGDPHPVDPQPVDPQPVNPQPGDPHPVHPQPVDPHPVHPQPVDPQPMYPQPVDPHPVHPQPGDPQCGVCTNCYYPVTNACFLGWTKAQCDFLDVYKWCGAGSSDPQPVDPQPVDPQPVDPHPVDPQPVDPHPVDSQPVHPQPVDPQCGVCTNCYYPVTNACFLGWSKAQCDSLDVYKWCGAGSSDPQPVDPQPVDPQPVDPQPVDPQPWNAPKPSHTCSPKRPPSSNPYTAKKLASSPSTGTSGVEKKVSWNWFASSTTDCDASLSKDTLNHGLYIGGENIPADCGKAATFTYNGHTVQATYAWRTTGGEGYNELSPQAFAQLLGSNANAADFNSATDFQAAINDPGHVYSTCSGTC
ncbi:hypothetical protein DYB26_006835 [Aphanomyces astaci]|uniref:Chitin-binding type-4 domain-containing protein n=1 Tax=Aphanomyces astaci TaxID=112090 RepID=A0A3R7BZE0_APHAT|nr:hypothetical protein DYB26_006835 [Aphanomyces astaci]